MNKEYKRIISQNRKARFEYMIEEVIEAGIVLKGSEVKSIRLGKVNIEHSYAVESKGEIYLQNAHIAEYDNANRFNHDPLARRKLLLHRKQISKFIGKIKLKGFTLVPLCLYFNSKNMIKLELGLAFGKKLHDKRQSLKEKDLKREQQSAMRKKI